MQAKMTDFYVKALETLCYICADINRESPRLVSDFKDDIQSFIGKLYYFFL